MLQLIEKVSKIEQKLDDALDLLVSKSVKWQSHIDEGEKAGGVRDRVTSVERKIDQLEKNYWRACLAAAFVGGLVARLAPDLLWKIIHHFLKSIV